MNTGRKNRTIQDQFHTQHSKEELPLLELGKRWLKSLAGLAGSTHLVQAVAPAAAGHGAAGELVHNDDLQGR
jgi:hypothetical protein